MSGSPGPTSELTATCHLLSFDSGLFCVSLSEPPPPAYANPHFPGVRLSLPPGPMSEHPGVTISTFRPDGWLDLMRPAALVHVADGPAKVLLTIYHEPGQPREAAPRLAITQLVQGHAPVSAAASPVSAVGASPAPAPPPWAGGPNLPLPMAPTPPQVVTGFTPQPAAAPSPAPPPNVVLHSGEETPATPLSDASLVAHIRNRGDVRVRMTDWIGLPGSRLWIEGFGLGLPPGWSAEDVEYQGVVARTGTTPWTSSPHFCGTRGETLPLLGFALRLRGTAARLYDCTYRASFIDGTTAGPVAQGQVCQSLSLAALEAFQITLLRR
ncbi:MAG: hypothetical protein J0H67_17275 [Rhodospirillales bacterium]|nr:hypothetical protein [Rhodospirillales bacterium]MBN8897566.1 hypothetical protein [Rhodospirillales bacterium]